MKKALLLSAICLAACTASAPDAANTADAPPQITYDFVPMDTLLSGAVTSGQHVGVSAMVFDEGKVVYQGAYGMADRERNVAVDMDTVFRIYSMTKPITSVVIMDLQDEGKLSIDDPVSKYIPELANMQVISMGEDGKPVFTPQAVPMTIKDLLLHRAGLGYGISGNINPVETLYAKAGLFEPSEDLSVKMTKLSKLPLLAQPGDGWYYSYSIDVLGRIAEVVEGKTLGEIMDARIFTPLGMEDTSFTVRADQKERLAVFYLLDDEGKYTAMVEDVRNPFSLDYTKKYVFQSGGGGLVGTLGDYAKFAQMMLGGGVYEGRRVLNEDTVKAMMSNQMDADDIFMMPWLGGANNSGFGYGGSVELDSTPEQMAMRGRSPGQWGWSGAGRTNFWVDPKNDAFGIIMLQYIGQQDPELHDKFRALALSQTKDEVED